MVESALGECCHGEHQKRDFHVFLFLCLPVRFDNKARESFSLFSSLPHSCILNKLNVTPMLNERTSDYRRVKLEFSFRELCVQAPVKIFIHEFTLSHFIFSRLSCPNNTPIIRYFLLKSNSLGSGTFRSAAQNS